MKTSILNVGGMHCSSCSMLVTMNLDDLDGVHSVKCDHVSGRTVVEFDDSKTSVDEIVRTVVDSGYTAEPAN